MKIRTGSEFDITAGQATVCWDYGWQAWALPGGGQTTDKKVAERIARRMDQIMSASAYRSSL